MYNARPVYIGYKFICSMPLAGVKVRKYTSRENTTLSVEYSIVCH